MALSKVVQKLNEAVKDLSSLHVQTYTGVLSFTQPDGDEEAAEKFNTVRQQVQEMKSSGTIQLVAEAYYQFDGDSYNFLSSDSVSDAAREMHKAAVEAGIKTRQGLFELVKSAFT